jgi:hypothetical protein
MPERLCSRSDCTERGPHQHRRRGFDLHAGLSWGELYDRDIVQLNAIRADLGLSRLIYESAASQTQELTWSPETGIQAVKPAEER